MALHATFDQAHLASRQTASRASTSQKPRGEHDLALKFWAIATPACLAFWAAVAWGLHSVF